MEEINFNDDCKTFEELIDTGKKLAEQAYSVREGSLDDAPKSEQMCTSWFVETRNFLIALFGEDDLDTHIFRKSFGKYQFMNLMGFYSGDWRFVKEDMYKGVGVLEGIYYSFKKHIKKRKNKLVKSLRESKDRIRVMFDNDVLNKIVEGQLDVDYIIKLDKFEFYATHIQSDQVNNCPDNEKRALLILNLTKLSPIVLPTESFVLGTSRLGEAKLGNGVVLDDLRKENQKHTPDALIGEVAIKKGILLVTNDKTLRYRVNVNSGRAINLDEFKDLVK
jgi:rRNA-processing protein FCF1